MENVLKKGVLVHVATDKNDCLEKVTPVMGTDSVHCSVTLKPQW